MELAPTVIKDSKNENMVLLYRDAYKSISDLSQEELIKKTKRAGITAIVDALMCIENGNVSLIKNDITKGSYYTFPTRSDVRAFYEAGKRFF